MKVLNSFDQLSYLFECEAKAQFSKNDSNSDLCRIEAKVMISFIDEHFNSQSQFDCKIIDREHKNLHKFFYCSIKDHSEHKNHNEVLTDLDLDMT